jgi:fructosamine-3-kinase
MAMAQLFGGFPKAFFSGYEDVWPLEPGAKARVVLYNLYHLLNHANLFGGGWGRQAQASIDQLLVKRS